MDDGRHAAEGSGKRYRGQVAYIFAFDIACELRCQPIRELLGQPVAEFAMDVSCLVILFMGLK